MTKQLEAVLMIASHPLLRERLLPRIDLAKERIDWDGAAAGLSGGEKALLSWAWCLWNDRQIPEVRDGDEDRGASLEAFWRDPFQGFNVMDRELQLLVVRALLHRQGVELGEGVRSEEKGLLASGEEF
jgi:hypothetical protein